MLMRVATVPGTRVVLIRSLMTIEENYVAVRGLFSLGSDRREDVC